MSAIRSATPGKLTLGGACLFVLGIFVLTYAYSNLRMPIAGLMVSPLVFPLIAFFIFFAIPRLKIFPQNIIFAISIFLAIYILSTLPQEDLLKENIKMIFTVITLITTVLLVKTDADFVSGVLGLTAAVTIMSIKGIFNFGESSNVVNPLIGIANKNAFSMYALPVILLTSHLIINKDTSKTLKTALMICVCIIASAIATSGNRSGLIGIVIVMVMLYWNKKTVKTSALLAALGAGTYYLISKFLSIAPINYAMERELPHSAEQRWQLFIGAVKIGLENPILGVSPEGLYKRQGLGMGMYAFEGGVHPHNVIAYIVGGSGVIAFIVFLYVGWLLWRGPASISRNYVDVRTKNSLRLLRMMLLLFVIRGMFSHEILYTPSFIMGIGLPFGLCIANNRLFSKGKYIIT